MNEDQKSPEGSIPTLCFPDFEKSCFACCPPIRQAGYEHIQHRKIVERILRENTAAFNVDDKEIVPITGFSCWALGYLDKNFRLVGCLLHPARNEQNDLRYLIDYGDKCGRETCPEAETFLTLTPLQRRFWLCLTKGLDSFSYSSRKDNPLFIILGWGKEILTKVFANTTDIVSDLDTFLDAFPFFTTSFSPKGHSYILEKILTIRGTEILTQKPFKEKFEMFVMGLLRELRAVRSFDPQDPYVHKLRNDRCFLDFLRLSVGVSRISEEKADSLKKLTDKAAKKFCSNL